MKLSDKSFTNGKPTKKQANSPTTQLLDAADVFDAIMREAQASGPNMLSPQGPTDVDTNTMSDNGTADASSDKLEDMVRALEDKGVPVADMMMKLMEVGKMATNGNNPAGTAANPIGGQRDSLSSEEIEGTGKIAQQDWDDVRPPEPKQQQNSSPTNVPEVQQGPLAPEIKQELPVDPKKEIADKIKNGDFKFKQNVILSYYAKLYKIEEERKTIVKEIDELCPPYSEKHNPASKQELAALAAEKKMLMDRLQSKQRAVSMMGSRWRGVVNLVKTNLEPKELAEVNKLIKMLQSKWVDMSAQSPKNHELTEIPEDVEVKKIGQAAPMPGDPAGGPPTPPASDASDMPVGEIGMAPDMVEEDKRTLEELLEDLGKDVETLTERVESGETLMDGQDIEPVTTDTGAEPAPAPMIADKQAVDSDAKEYYHELYGPYGDELAKDRIAEIVDMVDEMAADYKVNLTHAQVSRAASVVNKVFAKRAISGELLAVQEKLVANYLFKTGMVSDNLTDADVFTAGLWFQVGANLSDDVKTKLNLVANTMRSIEANQYIKHQGDSWVITQKGTGKVLSHHDSKEKAEAAFRAMEMHKHGQKMKQPSTINEQMDDQVKTDKLKDNAEDGDVMLARPGHLRMEIDDQHVDGAYLKLTIKWDSDDEAAVQSSDGIRHAVISFVKGLESTKEFTDYGFLGQPIIKELDVEAGMAVVQVRTQKPGDAPTHIKTSPE